MSRKEGMAWYSTHAFSLVGAILGISCGHQVNTLGGSICAFKQRELVERQNKVYRKVRGVQRKTQHLSIV
jgi:hypothetical protein